MRNFNINKNALSKDSHKNLNPIIHAQTVKLNKYIVYILSKTIAYLKYKLKSIKLQFHNNILLQNKQIHPINNIQKNYHILIWLKRFLYSREQVINFFNMPYFLSILITDTKECINKRTIYLYQIVIIITLPILIYRIKKNFNLTKNHNALQYIFYNTQLKVNFNQPFLTKIINKNSFIKTDNIYKNIEKTKKKLIHVDKINDLRHLSDIQSRAYQIYILKGREVKNKTLSVSQNNPCDTKRILDIIKNRWGIKKNISYHIKTILQDEWIPKDIFLYQLHPINSGSQFKKIASKEYNTFQLERKKNKTKINTNNTIDNIYFNFLKPTQIKELSRFCFEETNEDKNFLNNQSIALLQNIENTIPKTKRNNNSNLIKIIQWFYQYNISEQNQEKIKKAEILLTNLLNNKIKLIQQIPFWLNDREGNFRLKKFLPIYKTNIINKQNIISTLLNGKRKQWKYKTTEWIKNDFSSLKICSQAHSYNYLTQLLSNNQNYIKFLNTYWIIEKKTIFQNLETILNLWNIKKLSQNTLFNKNYYLKEVLNNNSYWNSLYCQFTNKNNNISTIQTSDSTIKYLPFQGNQEYTFVTNYRKRKYITQEIKQLYYLEDNTIPDSFVSIEKENIIGKSQILYNNIIKNTSNSSQYAKDPNKINSMIIHLSGKINNFILNSNIHNSNKRNKEVKNKIKYLHTHILEKKNLLVYFFPNDILLGKKYTNRTTSDNKKKNSTKDFSDKITKDFLLPNYLNEKIKTLSNNLDKVDEIKTQLFYINNNKDLKDNELATYNIINTFNKDKSLNINLDQNFQMLTKYNQWIFTSEWWLLIKKIISNQFLTIIQNIYDNKKSIYRPNIKYIVSKINNNWQQINNKTSLNFKNIIQEGFKKYNAFLLEELYTAKKKYIPIWDGYFFYKNINNKEWITIAWILTLSILYYQWVSIFIGTEYVYMWYQFEKMRLLSYPSSNTFLNILVKNSIELPSQQLRLTIYTSKGWIIWFKTKFLLYLVQNKFIARNFLRTFGIDVQRTKKNLVVNSLVTSNNLISKYQLWNSHKKIDTKNLNISKDIQYEGINYLYKWSRRYSRSPQIIGLSKSTSNQLEYLNDLFFDIEYSRTNFHFDRQNSFIIYQKQKPRILSENIALTKRWLLIGTIETGKSYIIKQIAAATHIPLIHISLKTIRQATPDLKYNQLTKYNKWIIQLADRGFLLSNVLRLAKILSPCIFWISDLHEFHATHNTKDQQEKIYDASLLLTILLKVMGHDLLPEKESNITLIGSSNNPALLDPKFVSPHRLDLIINLRKPSFYERQKIFTNLLNTKKLYIRTIRSFHELGNQTIGYSIRDIASLVNETCLIKLQDSKKFVNSDIIRLAVSRQISKQSANNKVLESQSLQYKIGKAIIQTILISAKPLVSITKKHDLWKTRFYYLSNIFLEFSIENSIVTELLMFIYIINYLAGSAARDAWIISQDKFNIEKLSINKKLRHDLSIASNLLQALLLEFPMREISNLNNSQTPILLYNSKKKYGFNIINKNVFSLSFFQRFTSYIYWSYRIERLSLNWTLLFDSIQKSNKDITIKLFSNSRKENESLVLKEKNIDKNIPYERRITKSQQKRSQKVNETFNKFVVDNNLKTMGFPWISEYVMHYDALQLSILLLETKTLWSPPVLTPSYSILFFNRDLLVNRNMLTKLYITYGEKFKIEKLNPKRVKKQVFWSDTVLQNSNPNPSSNNSKTTIISNIENFYYFQQMAKTKAQLEQLQLQPPVYLYQCWTFQDKLENGFYYNLLDNRASLQNNVLKDRELLIYSILVETYDFLLKFFIRNKKLTQKIEDTLVKYGSLNRESIEITLKNTKFI